LLAGVDDVQTFIASADDWPGAKEWAWADSREWGMKTSRLEEESPLKTSAARAYLLSIRGQSYQIPKLMHLPGLGGPLPGKDPGVI